MTHTIQPYTDNPWRPTPQLGERVAFVDAVRCVVYLGTVVHVDPVNVRWDDSFDDENGPWPPASWKDLYRVVDQ